jgi:hypothetical protein
MKAFAGLKIRGEKINPAPCERFFHENLSV